MTSAVWDVNQHRFGIASYPAGRSDAVPQERHLEDWKKAGGLDHAASLEPPWCGERARLLDAA